MIILAEEHKHGEHHNTEHKPEHKHAEHKVHHTEHKKVKLKKTSMWKILALILGVLFIISLFTHGFSGKTSEVKAINKQQVANDAIEYINKYLMGGGGTATLKDVTEQDNLYVVKLDIGGREYDSYVTKDGKYLFPQGIDITQEVEVTETPEQPSTQEPIEVSVDDDAFKGDANAPVTIVEFSDFQCPFCARFYTDTLPLIEKEYIETGKVKLVFRDFPLGFHQNAQKASEAAECAKEQGKFWEMHDTIFDNQNAISVDDLKQYAADLGLDTEKFNDCLDTGKYEQEVKKDMEEGQSYGVTGTPAFFINGRLVSGAQPFANFKAIIDEELSK